MCTSGNTLNLDSHSLANSATWHGPLEIAADCTIKNGTIRNNSLTGDALVTITGGNVVFEDVTFDCSNCTPQALVRIVFGSKANVTFKGNCRFLAANKNVDAIYVDYCTSGKVTFDSSFTGYVGGKVTLAYESTHPNDDPAVEVSIAGFGTFESSVSLDGGTFDFHNSSISIAGGRFAVMPNASCIASGYYRESDGSGYWSVCLDGSGDLNSPLTWVTSREEAFAQARAKGKKVFLLSGFDGTSSLIQTRDNSCENLSLKRYLKRDYICWYNDIETQIEESRKYFYQDEVGNVPPFIVIIDADADEKLTAEGGFHDADALRVMLGRVAKEVKATPESGSRFENSVQVSLSAQSGALIYYTLDGTLPTASAIRYERPITVTATTTIRAVAYVGGVLGLPVDAEFKEVRKATSGGYEWTAEVVDGGCSIVSVTPAPTGDVVIPAKIGGLDVVGFDRKVFQSNENITSVSIPAKVDEISAGQFSECKRLVMIHVDAANARYSSHDGIVYDKVRQVLVCCPVGVQRLEVPYGVKEIAAESCQQSDRLSSVIIPSSVTKIGDRAFLSCSQLGVVAIPESVTNIGNYVFTYCQHLENAWVPAHLKGDVIQNNSFWSGFYGLEINVHYYSGALTQITVQFNANGGELDDSTRTFMLAENKVIAAVFPVPTRFDHEFLGWFTAAFGGSEVTPETSVTGDMALYAHWGTISHVWEYDENPDGSVTITGGDPVSGRIALPSQIDGKTVTAVGFAAFANCHELFAVKIPSSVSSIEYAAFWNCSSLETVVFEGDENAVSIHGGAFAYTPYEESQPFECIISESVLTGFKGICPTEVVLPESVKAIGSEAFCPAYHPAAESLERVVFNEGLEVIGERAFSECGLREIVLPSTVTNIGLSAFYACTLVTSIVLNEGLVSIGDGAFGGGTTTDMTLPTTVKKITIGAFAGTDGAVTVRAPWSLWGVLDSGEVSETGEGGVVTTTVNVEFYGERPTVYTVTYLPGSGNVGGLSQTDVKTNAVHLTLKGAIFTRNGYTQTGWATSDGGAKAYNLSAAYTVNADATLYPIWTPITYSVSYSLNSGTHGTAHPSSATYDTAFYVSAPTKSGYTFAGWTVTSGLDTSTAKWGTTSEPSTSLTSASTKCVNGATGNVYFKNLRSTSGSVTLTANWNANTYTVTLNSQNGSGGTASVTATYGSAMPKITPPKLTGKTFGGYYTGTNGSGIKYYNADGASARAWDKTTATTLYAKWDAVSPTFTVEGGTLTVVTLNGCAEVTIPSGVTSIGRGVFQGCMDLRRITIPEGVSEVGDYAFYGCVGLTSLIMPNSITKVGSCAFRNCTNMTEIVISENLMNIGYEMFGGCTGLLSVTIPSAVTNIDDSAFYDCGLTHIVIPSNVVNIGAGAFSSCKNLSNVIIGDGVTKIDRLAFYGCSSLASVAIPNTVTNIGNIAFADCAGLTNITFEGNAPSVASDTFNGVGVGCMVFVKQDSSGWGVDIPGTWNGMQIGYVNSQPEPRVWTVTFDANGGVGTLAQQMFTNGIAQALGSNKFERTHYFFVGWALSSEVEPCYSDGEIVTLTDDITLFAKWHLMSYKVSYVSNGGYPSSGYGWIPALTPLSTWPLMQVTKDGCEFEGWFTEDGIHAADIVLSGNLTLYAHWKVPPVDICTVEFNPNGGVLDENIRSVQCGGNIGELPIPTRSGHMFLGWFTLAEGGEKIDDSTIVSGEMTCHAHWISNSTILIDMDESYMADTDGIVALALSNIVYSASTPKFTVKGLPSGVKYDSKTMTISGMATKPGVYKVTVSATSAIVKKPSVKTFELVVPNLTSKVLPGLKAETDDYGVVMCGVALAPALVDCKPEKDWAVKVAGLPAGLKYDAKTGAIVGVPTKAGTFTVTFTATKKGVKDKEVATITLTTEALPFWATGTFTGYVNDGEDYGSATMTIAANGKVSGKVSLGGTNWTFSAASFSRVEHVERVVGGISTNFVVEAEAKAGKATRPLRLEVYTESAPQSLVNALASGDFGDGQVGLWRNIWKDKATAAAAKAEIARWEGAYTLSFDDGGYLSLTVGKSGDVKASGKLADGTSVSASTPLAYNICWEGFFVMVCSSPSVYKGGFVFVPVGFGEDGRGRLRGIGAGPAVVSSRNPQATGEYGAGFERQLDFTGAYYDKTKKLNDYYEALRFEPGESPSLVYVHKRTYKDAATNKKVTESIAEIADAVDTLLNDDLTATVNDNGAFVVAKATKPMQDRVTKEWFYNGVNDGVLTLSFTQATGIFKGSYTFWYDYESVLDETKDKATMSHTSKKVSFEGVFVQGSESMRGFYLWDMTGGYKDSKTTKTKAYKYKESHSVMLVP